MDVGLAALLILIHLIILFLIRLYLFITQGLGSSWHKYTIQADSDDRTSNSLSGSSTLVLRYCWKCLISLANSTRTLLDSLDSIVIIIFF